MNELKILQLKLADMIKMWQREKEIAFKADARNYVYFLEGRIDGLNTVFLLIDSTMRNEEQSE